ncbi:lyase family protein [Streptomyces sp. NBS 14/10]|uniref:lyase family protein n=1 Tax=Streptomyces sp. NBS 14/10 TaxID=1945643 RepID=UPI001C52E0D6|nr:lyase family protein [Streptomyces sp. NBS 14/10]KAK1186010.1 lyase family protein [Streptomyces sp. NBS 14/10]
MLDAEAALTRAQAALGQAPGAAAGAVAGVARAELYDVRDLAVRARAGGNPVIPLVAEMTAAVARTDPEAAAYVHRGATSQDILDTAAMLVAARALPLILADLGRTATALGRLATAHRDTPMPARTLTQHAVPTTFGLKAAGWRALTLDAHDRLASLRPPAQLGGAGGTLAAFAALAEGFGVRSAAGQPPRPGDGTEQATAPARSQAPGERSVTGAGAERGGDTAAVASATAGPTRTDPAADAGGRTPGEVSGPTPDALGRAGVTAGATADTPARASVTTAAGSTTTAGATGTDDDLGVRLVARFADELGLAEPALPWHTLRTPVADLGAALAFAVGALGKVAADVLVLSRTEIGEVAEGSGGGSSAMPHKSNPVRATLVAAAARQAPGLAATLLGSLAAEDERPAGAWHAEWQPLRELLRLAGGAAREAAELAEGLRVFPRRMDEHLALTDGLIVSERIAAALAPLVGRSRAKELLTVASRRAREEGVALAEALAGALAEEPELAGVLSEARLRELTDPARYTGSAAALVDRALRRAEPDIPGSPQTGHA